MYHINNDKLAEILDAENDAKDNTRQRSNSRARAINIKSPKKRESLISRSLPTGQDFLSYQSQLEGWSEGASTDDEKTRNQLKLPLNPNTVSSPHRRRRDSDRSTSPNSIKDDEWDMQFQIDDLPPKKDELLDIDEEKKLHDGTIQPQMSDNNNNNKNKNKTNNNNNNNNKNKTNNNNNNTNKTSNNDNNNNNNNNNNKGKIKKGTSKEERRAAWEAKMGKNDNQQNKKKLSKKERRALQELQRAAKAAKQNEKQNNNKKKMMAQGKTVNPKVQKMDKNDEPKSPLISSIQRKRGHAPVMLQFDDPKKMAAYARKEIVHRTPLQKQVELFAHLPQYERESSLSLQVGFTSNEIHPVILRLGLKLAEGSIMGSNARAVALLNALKIVISEYNTPPNQVLSRDLDNKLKPLVRFIIDCRPLSISMGNAIRAIKMKIAKIPPTMPDNDAKQLLTKYIDSYVQERITFAIDTIVDRAVNKIDDGDIILTYASSSSVELTFKRAKEQGKNFHVIVVDSRPHLEGKKLVKRLQSVDIECSYILVNAVSYVINTVAKVFLGAYGMLSNGSLIARAGSAIVALMANTNKIPLIVLCETYKFSPRVQIESLAFNELGDPDQLISTDRPAQDTLFGEVLRDWRDLPYLKLLNLQYDLTPVQYVSMIITELGAIPPTSVPVILREYHQQRVN